MFLRGLRRLGASWGKSRFALRHQPYGTTSRTGHKPTIAFFDTKKYMQEAFLKANSHPDLNFMIDWFRDKLNAKNTVLAAGSKVVSIFVNDTADAEVIFKLQQHGVELLAVRAAGTDNVDLDACRKANISVTNVPAYSPHAVAEYAVGLMLTLNRKIHRAHMRVREHNFSLNHLEGFDFYGKTVGVIGTGHIGRLVAQIMMGFGCRVLATDVNPNPELSAKGALYVTKERLLGESDIVTLHTPLLPETRHTIDSAALSLAKPGMMLINTSRGGLVDSAALLQALSTGRVGAAGLDVLEEEKPYFFENHSEDIQVPDTTVELLIAHRNVLVTGHQAFLTREALDNIASATLQSVREYSEGKRGAQLTYSVIK